MRKSDIIKLSTVKFLTTMIKFVQQSSELFSVKNVKKVNFTYSFINPSYGFFCTVIHCS